MSKNEALRKNYFKVIEYEVGKELSPLEKIAVIPVHESYSPEECPHFLTSFAHISNALEGEICIHCGETLERRLVQV